MAINELLELPTVAYNELDFAELLIIVEVHGEIKRVTPNQFFRLFKTVELENLHD